MTEAYYYRGPFSVTLLALLDHLCAMLTRLGRMGDSSGETTRPGQRERGRER